MMPGYDINKLIADLLQPERYPHRPKSVTLAQTHASCVFLAGEYVYKMKKPVNFGFLDFSTPEKRRHFCEEEVRLNRRAAPGVYLGVVDISEVNGEYSPEDSSNPVEAAVKMRRLPDEASMYHLATENMLTDDTICRISRAIADFHAAADSGAQIDPGGSPGMTAHHALENLSQTSPFIGKTISPEIHALVHRYTDDFIVANLDRFLQRIADGRIRDCHGDLRPKHVFVFADHIDIIDCIEFNPAYRRHDTASDLAFMLMELDFMGRREVSAAMLNHYLDFTADYGMIPLFAFYKAYRAMVRGKVSSFTANDTSISDSQRESASASARKFFDLAAGYVSGSSLPPVLTITCGPSGSGKSTAARAHAAKTGAAVIRSDSLRKSLAGIHPSESARAAFGGGIYAPAHTERTYRKMFECAADALGSGCSVILDATFSKRRLRDEARLVAETHDSPFRMIWCDAPRELLEARIASRSVHGGDPSDANSGVLDAQLREFEALQNDEMTYVISATP
ncbi:MAG: AAA family ATPase [Nitrospirae bacterium]|nr:AAA family ATPase [Nitrospirota bacterium]